MSVWEYLFSVTHLILIMVVCVLILPVLFPVTHLILIMVVCVLILPVLFPVTHLILIMVVCVLIPTVLFSDPHQRLALFRKLEETTKLNPIRAPARKVLPRKEYFQGVSISAVYCEERKYYRIYRSCYVTLCLYYD